MRWGVLLLLAACGARVEDNSVVSDASPDSTIATVIDSGVDPPPDARPCTGGAAAAQSTDGACIVLFTTAESFADADVACVAFGARLAILSTAPRDAAAKSLIGATTDVFIGLTDQNVEGIFVWVDGTPVTFTHFNTGEPNNANGGFQEDCTMYDASLGGWDDRPCSNAVPGIGMTPGEYPYLCSF